MGGDPLKGSDRFSGRNFFHALGRFKFARLDSASGHGKYQAKG